MAHNTMLTTLRRFSKDLKRNNVKCFSLQWVTEGHTCTRSWYIPEVTTNTDLARLIAGVVRTQSYLVELDAKVNE